MPFTRKDDKRHMWLTEFFLQFCPLCVYIVYSVRFRAFFNFHRPYWSSTFKSEQCENTGCFVSNRHPRKKPICDFTNTGFHQHHLWFCRDFMWWSQSYGRPRMTIIKRHCAYCMWHNEKLAYRTVVMSFCRENIVDLWRSWFDVYDFAYAHEIGKRS